MKIQELRIGNKVSFKDTMVEIAGVSGIAYSFDAIDVTIFHGGKTEMHDLKTLSPIPLTEEILLKCGFYQENGVMSYATQDYSSVKITYETLAKYYRLYPYTYRIDYLHQLQNLYFALTGEELEVKL